MSYEQDARDESGVSMLAIATGAAAGALAIYILRSPAGRRLLDTAIGLLEDFAKEAVRFQQAYARAQAAASQGWQTVQSSSMNTGGGRETVF